MAGYNPSAINKQKRSKDGMLLCKKCGKPVNECVDFTAAKRRIFLRAYAKFMED